MKLLLCTHNVKGRHQKIHTVEEWFDCDEPDDLILVKLCVAFDLVQERESGWAERVRILLWELRPQNIGMNEWFEMLYLSTMPPRMM